MPRLITDILRDIRKGRVVEAASEDLAEIVRAVVHTGKPGELTLKIKVELNGKNDNAVIMKVKSVPKPPQADLPDALFFADSDGDLLREDPTQQRIFTDVTGEKIDQRTGEVLSA